MGEGATRMAVHRLRRRYGELLRNEIAQTVGEPEEIEDETLQEKTWYRERETDWL